ncbi:MAG TPA: SRPBCC family protein [Polyangiales bacterium]
MIVIDGRRATFMVAHTFSCSPDVLWTWLTEPHLVARWVRADVHMAEPFMRGTERTVTIRLGPLPVQKLREVITAVDRPRGFSYRGLSFEGHEGQVAVRTTLAGCELRWKAGFEAPHRLLAWPLARYVCMQMADSFARLARLITRAESSPLAAQ